MVDLGGYVIILVETKEKKVKLYGAYTVYTSSARGREKELIKSWGRPKEVRNALACCYLFSRSPYRVAFSAKVGKAKPARDMNGDPIKLGA